MPEIRQLFTLIIIGLYSSATIFAQGYESEGTTKEVEKFQWPDGKKMALSLTFDDARLSQIDKGIPLLDKYGIKGTFYLSPGAMLQRTEGWKKAVAIFFGREIKPWRSTH